MNHWHVNNAAALSHPEYIGDGIGPEDYEPREGEVMETRYAIGATVREYRDDGWTATRQIPTFYLDANVQGIMSEDQACIIARRILDPLGQGLALSITAVAV